MQVQYNKNQCVQNLKNIQLVFSKKKKVKSGNMFFHNVQSFCSNKKAVNTMFIINNRNRSNEIPSTDMTRTDTMKCI